jgi:hypothetical protein
MNQVVLMLYLYQSLRSRSMPTVAPKMPRDTSVGFAGEPSHVLSLHHQRSLYYREGTKAYQPLTASTSTPYPTRTRFTMMI